MSLPAGRPRAADAAAPSPAGRSGVRAATRRLFVKICGVRDEEAARAAAAGADAVGFVFHRPSRRWVEPSLAARLGALLPADLWRVGVFVDAPPEEVAATVEAARLTAVQLHGEEGPELAALLRRRLGVAVIKALRLASPADLERGRAWAASPPDLFLLEGAGEAPGGTGRAFDWRWAAGAGAVLPAPFLLAGGLTPANVTEALAAVRPAGVDVSSGVERDGRKDPALIRAFVAEVRRWEAGAGAGEGGPSGGGTGAEVGRWP